MIRLLIGAITVSLIFSGMAVAVENPQEAISRSSGKTLYCIHCHNEKFETGSLRIMKIVMQKQCKGCHFNEVDGG